MLEATDKSLVDPRLLPALAEVAAAKYDGAAHVELAETLSSAKEYARAFTALMTAAFWQARRKAEVDVAIHERARALAHEARWVDIADALDEMHDVRTELVEEGEWQ